jgi:hypothetical protein
LSLSAWQPDAHPSSKAELSDAVTEGRAIDDEEMSTTTKRIALHALACLLLATAGVAQIKTKHSCVVLFGSTANCSQPATIHYKKVQKATEEWKTIRSKGVRKGSARYDLLITRMNKRIKAACAAAAKAESRDVVVRKGDIKHADGLTVTDLTDAVIAELDS